ncbi:uncharacterized protein LOC126380933 isoform X1 [Pectinophora gossypiella]|uniref:uncharacterized protein LOC126380721 isoform X1 n=1 Tax=Pectinophora gossypiella TaxID=13191 RepID=UPI00214EB646|nr:uncharacterized protein LOC126380721 isoform X1 [Pectinophora gossypiella]XP_049886460.1 uncharacterized protein LOC126380933 isoform X1 [Pectinophora gossypiella]
MISGINNVQVPISVTGDVRICSINESFNTNLKCLVVPEITGQLPNHYFDVSKLNIPKHYNMADPNFSRPSDIDILLGADIFYDVLNAQKVPLGPNLPILQGTKLGWIVVGPLGTRDKPSASYCHFTKEISENLTRFWRLEEISSTSSKMSTEEEYCEDHFLKNTYRDNNGRFSVLMPLKEPETSLGDSYRMAEKRFYNLEKKLDKNLDLKNQYHNFIKEYESLGHLSKTKKPNFGYYMPHHAVIREGSETTKLRTVFDASAKTTSLKSLNDIQYTGPVVQDELFDILLRFRQHRYVLTGDIQKMYRQILIDESQRHLQLILWRYNKYEPLQVYKLNTVTYGTASAPYLSTRCLLQLALECPDKSIANVIRHDFYMDDMLTGADSDVELAHVLNQVTSVLNSACLPLHKYRTNCPHIFNDETMTESLNLNKQSSVLGLGWTPDTDTLNFSININKNTDKITKRVILSNTCKIFDPLGLLSPCTVTLKILLQKLWQLKLGWDEVVPNDINKIWNKMITDLELLLSVSVPRHALCVAPTVCELHCFVDASKDAYAACAYLRTVNQTNQMSPFLDSEGVLRVGGRLNNTNFNFNKKHPALLDGKHYFTRLLMRAEHLRLLHAGPQLLLATFRDQFWPLGGRTLARKVTRECVICTRFRGQTMEPLMGHLPEDRVTQNYPFQVSGMDFAGPLLISSKKGRGNRISKCYLCLFICFCTKAIHLEIVSDLSTNAFISCLRRFISRRGKPDKLYCDNATNFVGANNELGRALLSSLKSVYEFAAEEGIKFNFNPPYSPTFGGLWEAGIKSAKYHMKRIVGNASLTYEELSTLCTQIEAVLNSRPLTPMSPDSHDLSPLTPGHFLVGRPLTSLPSPPMATTKKLTSRYQLIEALREHFWIRWHNEYLSELQKRTKWRSPYTSLKEGSMVVFKENNVPPMKWRLGRLHRHYPGKDGVARVADFVTYRGIERRALNKVCPLMLEEDMLEKASTSTIPVVSSASPKAPQDVYDDRETRVEARGGSGAGAARPIQLRQTFAHTTS